MKFVRVGELVKELNLKLLACGSGFRRPIFKPLVSRASLELAGFFGAFDPTRVVVFGRGEVKYLLALPEKIGKLRLYKVISTGIPCVVTSYNQNLPSSFLQVFKSLKVPLLSSPLPTSKLIAEIVNLLERKLSPAESIHAVMMDVFGEGVLIRGGSGIGKSEIALELIRRGHRLVADDVVLLRKSTSGDLVASSFPTTKGIMEISGIGLIHVAKLFGISAILDEKKVDVVVDLVPKKETEAVRKKLGMEEDTVEFLGVRVPRVELEVKSGRNMAVLIELIAMNRHVKKYDPYLVEKIILRIRGEIGDNEFF